MKRIISSLVLLLTITSAFAYQMMDTEVTIGALVKPDDSAVLQVESTTKGFAPPRMTEVQRDAIAAPLEGLMVFNTDTFSLNVFGGGSWSSAGGGGGADHPLWTPSTIYGVGFIIVDDVGAFKVYRANTAHTSDATLFVNDIANWDELSDLTLLGGTPGSINFLGAASEITEDVANLSWNDTTNRMGIGTIEQLVRLSVVGIGSSNSTIEAVAYIGNPGFRPTMRMRSARGSEAAPARLQTNDAMGSLEFQAHNGIVFTQASKITVDATEQWSAVLGASDMSFFVNPAGVTGQTLSLVLNADLTADFTGTVSTPQVRVVSTTVSSTPCPVMTTVQRDAIVTPLDGDCVYNSTTSVLNTYDGAAWVAVGGGSSDELNANLSTGIFTGGAISINGGVPANFDIADGQGIVVNSYTDPLNPAVTLVTWTGLTNIAVSNIAGDFTGLGITSAGTIFQVTDAVLTGDQKRDNIALGSVVHTSHTQIDAIADRKQIAFGGLSNLWDLFDAIGPINKSGNVYSANGANLFLDRSAGVTIVSGDNYINSKKDPHTLTSAISTNLTWNYNYQDGGGNFTLVPSITTLDPGFYDDGSGTLASVGNNNWSVQRIFFGAASGISVIQYGQEEYNTFTAANAGRDTEDFTANPALASLSFRTWLIVRGGGSDLSDSGDAVFINAGKFGTSGGGSGGAGSSGDMQTAYDNSVAPQVVLDGTRNGIQYRDNSTPIGVALFSVMTNAAANIFEVVAGGIRLVLGATINEFSTDGTLAGDSDTAVPTEKAVKTYVDAQVGGGGDVTGPGASTDNAVARFDSTTGKIIQNSGVIIDDSDIITSSGSLVNGRLEVTSTTLSSRPCPLMTQAQRLSVTPLEGDCAWDTTGSFLSFYDGTQWINATTGDPAPTDDFMSVDAYTGTGASLAIVTSTFLNLSLDGGLVWLKEFGANQHALIDNYRGLTKVLATNNSAVEITDATAMDSFNSNGFTLGSGGANNTSSNSYIAWSFKEQPGHFDIVQYTGTGSAHTESHNLGVKPEFMLVKSSSNAEHWSIYADTTNTGATRIGFFTTAAFSINSGYWNSTEPTSSVFTVGNTGATNLNTGTFMAYLFGGPNVNCSENVPNSATSITPNAGKDIKFVLVKPIVATGDLLLFDDTRGTANTDVLYPGLTSANDTGSFNVGGAMIVGDTFFPERLNPSSTDNQLVCIINEP